MPSGPRLGALDAARPRDAPAWLPAGGYAAEGPISRGCSRPRGAGHGSRGSQGRGGAAREGRGARGCPSPLPTGPGIGFLSLLPVPISALTTSWVCSANRYPCPTTLVVLRPPSLEFLLEYSITRLSLTKLSSQKFECNGASATFHALLTGVRRTQAGMGL